MAQPQAPVVIDWANSLTDNLVLCFCAIPGQNTMVDLTGASRTVSGTTYPTRTSGVAFDTWSITNASSTDLDFTSGPWAVASFSHCSVVPSVNGQNIGSIVRNDYTSETVNAGWALGGTNYAPGDNRWVIFTFHNNAYTNYTLVGTSQCYVGDVFLGATSDGTTRQIFVNGSQQAASAVNPNPLTSTGVMNNYNPANGAFDGSYVLFAWNRDVLAAEWAALNTDPWAFLIPATPIVTAWPRPAVTFR